jgi:hypothetical protein
VTVSRVTDPTAKATSSRRASFRHGCGTGHSAERPLGKPSHGESGRHTACRLPQPKHTSRSRQSGAHSWNCVPRAPIVEC